VTIYGKSGPQAKRGPESRPFAQMWHLRLSRNGKYKNNGAAFSKTAKIAVKYFVARKTTFFFI
jgi:hypothetical protein